MAHCPEARDLLASPEFQAVRPACGKGRWSPTPRSFA